MFKVLSAMAITAFLFGCATHESTKQFFSSKSKISCVGANCNDRSRQMQAALVARTISDNSIANTHVSTKPNLSAQSNRAIINREIDRNAQMDKVETKGKADIESVVNIEPTAGPQNLVNESNNESQTNKNTIALAADTNSSEKLSVDKPPTETVATVADTVNASGSTTKIELDLNGNYSYAHSTSGVSSSTNTLFDIKNFISTNINNFDIKRYWSQPSWLTQEEWYWIRVFLITIIIVAGILALIPSLFIPKSVRMTQYSTSYSGGRIGSFSSRSKSNNRDIHNHKRPSRSTEW